MPILELHRAIRRLLTICSEADFKSYNLCRINMVLHDIDYDKFNIAHEDTLMNLQHWNEESFEVIVSNPTLSIK